MHLVGFIIRIDVRRYLMERFFFTSDVLLASYSTFKVGLVIFQILNGMLLPTA